MNSTTTQAAVRIAPRDSSFAGRVAAHTLALPPELTEKAVVRLGWTAAIYASVFVLLFWIHQSAANEAVAPYRRFFFLATSAAVVLGSGMWLITRYSRLPAKLILDLGLIFEVLGALIIALTQSRYPLRSDGVPQSDSSIALWIVFFVLVVPAAPFKAALAAFSAACMGPIGRAAVVVIFGVPSPPASHWLILHVADFVMAFAAVAMTRYVYDLGTQLSREREMGSYVLVDRIGQGGMGEVWRARHRMLAREAAVKLIRPETLGAMNADNAATMRKRFEIEAKATAALQSPNTVTIYDYGVSSEGVFYYVMELLQGLDLDDFVRKFGAMPPGRAIYLLRQICDSLEEAHAAGLVHRDIKPRNVFLCRLGTNCDFVKVLDFGLVKRHTTDDAATHLTREGAAAGTPGFFAPEAATGTVVDHRADIYAAGCLAYWLVTGELVFPHSNPMAMVVDHLNKKPPVPSERSRFDLPEGLDQLILDCLEKDPALRPQNAADLRRRLDALLADWDSAAARLWWDTNLPATRFSLTA